MGRAYETLRYEVDETGVATIALDQPDSRNALSEPLLHDLLAAFAAARDDTAVRCVLLASTHPTTFSAGGNLGGMAADVPLPEKHDLNGLFPRLFTLIGGLGKPVICVVGGHCLAGAFGLALACDLIVASERATFGTPEITVGVFPFMIAALIYRNLPRKKATELMLLGQRIDAAEARAAGDRQHGRRARPARAGRARVGDGARVEVAAADEARQGRALEPGRPDRSRPPGSCCAPS